MFDVYLLARLLGGRGRSGFFARWGAGVLAARQGRRLARRARRYASVPDARRRYARAGGVIQMFVEYMTAILAGSGFGAMGWLVLFFGQARRS